MPQKKECWNLPSMRTILLIGKYCFSAEKAFPPFDLISLVQVDKHLIKKILNLMGKCMINNPKLMFVM